MRAFCTLGLALLAGCAAVAAEDESCEDVQRICLANTDCPGGYRCNGGFNPPACTRLFCGTQDHPCDNDNLCADGFTCVQDGMCRSSLPLGSGCGVEAFGDFPCDVGLSCEWLAGSDFGYCVSPEIEGSPCEPGVFECNAPLVCNGECVDPDREGTPCDNELVQCGDGLACGGDPATCEPPGSGQQGAGCLDDEYCAAQLSCRSAQWEDMPRQCLPEAELGEFCEADSECDGELVCLFSSCGPRGEQGDPCQWAEHCEPALVCGEFAGEATCLGTAGPGDPCELHTDCSTGECADCDDDFENCSCVE
jgi:hypothetical protein